MKHLWSAALAASVVFASAAGAQTPSFTKEDKLGLAAPAPFGEKKPGAAPAAAAPADYSAYCDPDIEDCAYADPFGLDMSFAYDFGDNTSWNAFDFLCNDPRFTGEGMMTPLDVEPGHDADDCATSYDVGTIQLRDGQTLPPSSGGGAADTLAAGAAGEMSQEEFARSMRDTLGAGISYYFGDDASLLANDNVCDDTRFEGSGMGPGTVNDVNGHDATDCMTQYYVQGVTVRPAVQVPQFDMGDDAGTAPFDGLCDDPRFVGIGAAGIAVEANRFHDATDCQVAWAFGLLIPVEGPPQ